MAFVGWVVQFVDKPETGRVTRLNINNPGAIEVDGVINLGNAERTPTLADPDGRDGSVVTQTKRPNRTVTVPLRIRGDSLACAAAIASLSRECARNLNYLEFWPKGEGSAASSSVFFKVLSGDVSAPEFDNAGAGQWVCDLSLLCEPAALGPTETLAVSVSADPANASFRYTFPTIKGDVAAPVKVLAVPEAASTDASGPMMLTVTSRYDTPAVALFQAEGATLSNNTTVAASNDAVMSGTGANYVTVAPTNTSYLQRVDWPSTALAHGTYRAIARVRRSLAGDVWSLGVSMANLVETDPVTYSGTTTGPHLVDLGLVAHPIAGALPGDVTAVIDPRLKAGRVSGTGNLDVDCLFLIPVDLIDGVRTDTVVALPSQDVGGISAGWEFSDTTVRAVQTSPAGRPSNALPAAPVGSLDQRVTPGANNYLYFLRRLYEPGAFADGVDYTSTALASRSTSITWSYNPRYLFVAAP